MNLGYPVCHQYWQLNGGYQWIAVYDESALRVELLHIGVMAGRKTRSVVFAPEDPSIHVLLAADVGKTWMPGIKPGMTDKA
jgi:hypothetical protein